jgi:Predicted nucleotide-binding protein containing TIR-like domain
VKVFIASSTESLEVARELAAWLQEDGLMPVIWEDPGVFHPGEFNYESLLRISNDPDIQAAVIIMNTDDKVWYRKEVTRQPRDNVFIEYGLFSARLGIKRAIIVQYGDIKQASDLAGLNHINMSEASKRRARLEVTKWSEQLLSQAKGLPEDVLAQESCQADWKIAERRARKIGVDIETRDASNLFFILLSVVDCHKSRIAIGDLQAGIFENISIEAAYDLMGAWDLLIKFHSESDSIANEFYQAAIETLVSKRMMDGNENEPFGKRYLVSVLTQSRTINTLLTPNNDEVISYVLLPDNSDYDKFRASRSFIIIQARGDRGSQQRKVFLRELSKATEDGVGKSIIESICEGEKELVIETLSTCSQSNAIKHLNRQIEPVLSTHNLQKYTLSCYYHDESGMLSNARYIKEAI